MKINNKVFIYIASVSLALFSCSSHPVEIVGGASDLEISACAIEGKAVDSLGNVLIGAVVHLRTINYLSGILNKDSSINSSADTITNSNGIFLLHSIDTGTFNIEVNFHDSLGTQIPFTIYPKDSFKIFGQDTLRPLATISGHVDVNNYDNNLSESPKVRVFGLERRVKPDSTGHYSLKVPAGKQRLIFSADSFQFKPFEFAVDVLPGEPANIDIRIGNNHPPFFCPEYNCDSLAVRNFLDSSALTSISVDSVTTKEFGRITRLNLSNLSLKKLYPGIEQLQKLRSLDLSHNQLNDSIKSVYSLRNLEVLNLKGNQITTITRNIENLEFLKTLDISDNELTSISSSITKRNLNTFDVSNNKLAISSMSGFLITWLDENDPDWRISQKPPQ
jgi:Leucine-rich repeat (LRR) protein